VLEFQHSPLEVSEIIEREAYWKRLVWVFDAREWFKNFDLRFRAEKITFRWKHPRRSLFAAQCPVYLDTGIELFEILFLGRKVPCGGTGRFIPYRYFIEEMQRSSRL